MSEGIESVPICGEYGVRYAVLPRDGDSCDNKGDGVRLVVYSGTVLGSTSGEPFCETT